MRKNSIKGSPSHGCAKQAAKTHADLNKQATEAIESSKGEGEEGLEWSYARCVRAQIMLLRGSGC